MVIDLRALSTKQINFGVLPHHLAARRYRQANNENKNLDYRRHHNPNIHLLAR